LLGLLTDQLSTWDRLIKPAITNIPAVIISLGFQTADEITNVCSNYKAKTKTQGYVATQARIFVPDGVGIIWSEESIINVAGAVATPSCSTHLPHRSI
jgi:hypothetical protein